jgi:hypothetical protein
MHLGPGRKGWQEQALSVNSSLALDSHLEVTIRDLKLQSVNALARGAFFVRRSAMSMTSARDPEPLEPLIYTVRGHRVILDSDLARLYGVPTGRVNEAFKRSRSRFPPDFAFQITALELSNLRSQFAISSSQPVDSNSEKSMWSQFATGSHGGRRYPPWGFTEHGALMAANILRSRLAVQMSVFVVRAFVRLREQVAANEAILKRLAEIDQTLLQHDASLRDIYRKLLPLLQPAPESPKRRIGFTPGDC